MANALPMYARVGREFYFPSNFFIRSTTVDGCAMYFFVDVVGGDHRAGAGHVLDPDVRIAGDVFRRPIRCSGNARRRIRSSFGADLTKSSYFPPLHFGAHRTSVLL